MVLSKIDYFYRRKIAPGLKIKKKDLVLDIGSGDKPFWRGNVFLDKLSLGNLHRHTDSQTLKSFGIFVDGDITKTKFKDKVFDFSFCTHLLEHVDRPDLALDEIMRISKRGYIEVPNGVIEFISPFHSHIWFILESNKKLIFIRKNKKMHYYLLDNSRKFNNVINNMKDPFIRLYWNKTIEFEIIDNEPVRNKYFPPDKTPKTSKNPVLLKLSSFFYVTFILILRFIYNVDKQKINKDLFKK